MHLFLTHPPFVPQILHFSTPGWATWKRLFSELIRNLTNLNFFLTSFAVQIKVNSLFCNYLNMVSSAALVLLGSHVDYKEIAVQPTRFTGFKSTVCFVCVFFIFFHLFSFSLPTTYTDQTIQKNRFQHWL